MNVEKLFQTAVNEADEAFVSEKKKEYEIALKKYENAIEILNSAKKIDESHDLDMLEKIDIKIEEFRNRIEIIQAKAQKYIGIKAFKNGEFDKAIEIFKKEIELNPNSYEGLNNLGSSYREIGDFGKAIEAYKNLRRNLRRKALRRKNKIVFKK